MTACVNKKHTRRVALAISASLVGALSLGAAATPVFAENSVETQSATSQQALTAGKVTAAITTNNDKVVFNQDGSISVVASAEGIRGVYATEIQVGNQTITLTEQGYEDGLYTVRFFKKGTIVFDADDRPVGNGSAYEVTPHAVGDYTALIDFNAGSGYEGLRKAYDFRITPAEIGDVTVVNTETGDGTFTYDATQQIDNAQILVDGKKVNLSAFDVEWYAIGDVSAGANKVVTRNAKNAGNYAVKLTGKAGTIYAGSTDWGYFTVDKLDLKNAVVVINDMTLSDLKTYGTPSKVTPPVASVNGKSAVCSELTATFVGSTTGTVDEPGEYTFKVAPTDPGNANIINSAESVKFNAVESMLADGNFLYSEGQLKPTYNIDARRESFNTALIKVTDLDGRQLDKAGYTVTVTDAEGNPVTDTELKRGGKFNLTVSVNASYYEYKIGGKASSEITIINGVVQSANVYFTYDGIVGGNKATDTYDGTNLLDKLAIDVYDDLGLELTAGEDYDVVVTDADGNVVTEAVDAGTYTVTVSSDSYAMTTEEFELTVSPISVVSVRVSNLTAFGDDEVFPYTGSDITPVFEYTDSEGNTGTLPADTYEVVARLSDTLHGEYDVVDAINEVGYYEVYLHQAEGVKNYEIGKGADKGFVVISNSIDVIGDGLAEKHGVIEVSDQKVFADVENTFWGAQGVFDAVDLGYMSGYKGTTFFGPLDHLTRAQAAVVLYNMGTGRSVPETSTLHVSWVERGLAFPDAEQWYAAELGWASQVGVVSGYPNGNYGGSDEITREQFAIMLRNYAAAKGEDVTVDDVDAALEGIQDADTISGWAREAVAWAVENGVMGAEGYVYADQSIERAQAALMVTRYQPEKLSKDDYLVGNVK